MAVTLSLNTSLHTHAQTLSLLALQRSTPNLPFQLIVPGRTLLKRGPLFQMERSTPPREREFLLFSDCLVWLAEEEGWGLGWGTPNSSDARPTRPGMVRSRSKSEAELTMLKARAAALNSSDDNNGRAKTKSVLPLPRKKDKDRNRHASSTEEERWVYKGRAELVDLEVIVSPPREAGEERRFEVLSPEESFVLYAGMFVPFLVCGPKESYV